MSIFSLFEELGVIILSVYGIWCQYYYFKKLGDNVHTLFEELGDDVVNEPLLCELQVVRVRGEERDTASVVQSLQSQLVLNINHLT